MEKEQVLGCAALGIVTALTVFTAGRLPERDPVSRENPDSFPFYEELLATSPVAVVEGETVSPDGRYEVRTVGETDLYVSGYVIPESLQVVDLDSGDVVWEDKGWLMQRAAWSPDGRYLALDYGARTWASVCVMETDTWTAWDFTLPDGSPIPEYTFLPEDWSQWTEDGCLLLTVGRGGDDGEQRVYHCAFRMEGDLLTGETTEVEDTSI